MSSKWMLALGLAGLIVLGLMAYIRLAPTDAARWHVAPGAEADADLPGGVKRRIARMGPSSLERLDGIIRATPRTRVLAGSVEEGRITYVTRSLVWGFPDYTTVEDTGEAIEIHGRLRFGGSDMGVNRARVDGWLTELARIEG